MEKNELASSLNEILVLIGVKKKGNYWGAVVMKLQKWLNFKNHNSVIAIM